MKVKVLAFEMRSFVDRQSGKEVIFYRCCVQTEEGKVGFVNSRRMPAVGSLLNLTLKTKADNSFYVTVAE